MKQFLPRATVDIFVSHQNISDVKFVTHYACLLVFRICFASYHNNFRILTYDGFYNISVLSICESRLYNLHATVVASAEFDYSY